ncbi:MAG: chemotaxis protein CheW [Pseudomonadota bacterium]
MQQATDLNAQAEEELAVDTVKYVTFTLAEENYALSAASVNEVLRHSEITPVPGAPGFVLGIINLRGDVVTVVDARRVFGLSRAEATGQSRIVVIELEDYVIGVLVDRVTAVVDLREDRMEASPNTGNDAANRFIQGVYNEDDEALLILVDFAALATM